MFNVRKLILRLFIISLPVLFLNATSEAEMEMNEVIKIAQTPLVKTQIRIDMECNAFQVETKILGSKGYSFKVTTPGIGKYEWYVQGKLYRQQKNGIEVNNSTSFFLHSIVANADYEICAIRADLDIDCEACTILNVGCPEIKISSMENGKPDSNNTTAWTFIAYEENSVSNGYKWTVNGMDAVFERRDSSKMKYTFQENGLYEICAKPLSFRCDDTIICETIVINNL